jgi:hypothetical protein
MNNIQKNDFLHAFNMLADCYGKTFSETVGEMYWKSLNRFDLASIEFALYKHLHDPETRNRMPLPADVIRHLEGSAQKASAAWQRVVRVIKYIGAYHTVVFDDVLIHAAIDDLGGWIALCKRFESELGEKAREFEQRYAFYCIYSPKNYPRALIGIHDHQNSVYGFDRELPVYVGDIEKAKQVYAQGLMQSSRDDKIFPRGKHFVETKGMNPFISKTIH